jgi:DNA-binding transcriptional regulator YdaS (Cro superfamily)
MQHNLGHNLTFEKSAAKSALQCACDAAGGQKSLAARIGTTQSLVWYWLARSKRGVPGEYVLPIEAATGVSRHALRPDLYPFSKPDTDTETA